MKNIGIFSTQLNKNHIVFYESLSHLINKNSNVQVFHFLDNWLCENFSTNNEKSKDILIPNRSKFELLNYCYNLRYLMKIDLLIVDPFFSKPLFILFILLFNVKYSLVVHNVNYWLKPDSTFNVKLVLKKILNKIILSRSSSLIVVNTRLKSYAQRLTRKKIYSLPFNLPLSLGLENISNNNENIFIVVPGNVSRERREYFTLFKAFDLLMLKSNKYNLVLLGKVDSDDDDLLGEILRLKCQYPQNLLSWNKFVEDGEFLEIAIKATFFVAPLVRYFRTDLSTEEYGNTKETGVTSFVRRFNKVCFAPEFVFFESDLDHLIIHYSSHEDLASKIILASLEVSTIYNTSNLSENYMLNSIREINDLINYSCFN